MMHIIWTLFLISTDDTHMPWASALTIHLRTALLRITTLILSISLIRFRFASRTQRNGFPQPPAERSRFVWTPPCYFLKENGKTVQLGSAPIIQGDYIFYYCFSISQEIASFLHQVSKKTGMPVYFFEPKEWALRCCWKNKIRLVKKYGPEAFLN